MQDAGKQLQGQFAFYDFDPMSADTDICDPVCLLRCAHIDVAGSLHLDALEVVDLLIGRDDAIADHPGDRATGSGTRGGVFASGKKAARADGDLRIAGVAGEVVEID